MLRTAAIAVLAAGILLMVPGSDAAAGISIHFSTGHGPHHKRHHGFRGHGHQHRHGHRHHRGFRGNRRFHYYGFGHPYSAPGLHRHGHHRGCVPAFTRARDRYGRPVLIRESLCHDRYGRPFLRGRH